MPPNMMPGAAQMMPPGANPRHPLGGAWPGTAMDMNVDMGLMGPGYAIENSADDEYHNTGRGWSVAMPNVEPDAPRSFLQSLTGGPARGGYNTYGAAAAAIVARMGRLTFNLVLLAIILAVLAIPISLGLLRLSTIRQLLPIPAHPTAAVPTIVAGPGFQIYSSPQFGLAYPTGWTHTNSTQSVAQVGTFQQDDFTDPTTATTIFTVDTLQAVPSDHLQLTLDTLAQSYRRGSAANFTPLSAPAQGGTLAGHAAPEDVFTFDYNMGSKTLSMQGAALAYTQGLTTYVVIYAAPKAQFGAIQKQTFAPILASLRLPAQN